MDEKVIRKGISYGERRIEITVYTNFLKYIGAICILISTFSFFYSGEEYFVTIITLIVIGLIMVAAGIGWELYDKYVFKKLKREMDGEEKENGDYI